MQKILDVDYFIPEILMVKWFCDMTRREHILVDNLKVYIINEEETILVSYNSINLSFQIILNVTIPRRTTKFTTYKAT